MSRFVQIHALMTYPPGNPNRDDLGRPKTVVIGGSERQRISSQCLKRTWRHSEAFEQHAQGIRTKDVVGSVHAQLLKAGVPAEKAMLLSAKVGAAVGSQPIVTAKKGKAKKDADSDGQEATSRGNEGVLTFLTAREVHGIKAIVSKLSSNHDEDIESELAGLPSVDADRRPKGVGNDIALFGRMIAGPSEKDRKEAKKKGVSFPEQPLGIDAALQVAHAFTVHKAGLEVDYWTGVSDPDPWFDAAKSISEAGRGAGMIDTQSFGGGVFYLYACVNRTQLEGNLGDDADAARQTIRALVRAMATTTPGGKKTAFATNARADFLLVEQGESQPRSLAAAFHQPMNAETTPTQAAARLAEHKSSLDASYDEKWEQAWFGAGPDFGSVPLGGKKNGLQAVLEAI